MQNFSNYISFYTGKPLKYNGSTTILIFSPENRVLMYGTPTNIERTGQFEIDPLDCTQKTMASSSAVLYSFSDGEQLRQQLENVLSLPIPLIFFVDCDSDVLNEQLKNYEKQLVRLCEVNEGYEVFGYRRRDLKNSLDQQQLF